VTAAYLLDTNAVTAILKRNPRVLEKLRARLRANCSILISAVVYHEIRRGLIKRDAMRQLAHFEAMVRDWTWLDVQRSHWEAAATEWAMCQIRGVTVNDADLLLAAQARLAQAVLVTNDCNFDSFDVEREDWTAMAA
jgi:tRNA(fMet)-specific endonuclease VapC